MSEKTLGLCPNCGTIRRLQAGKVEPHKTPTIIPRDCGSNVEPGVLPLDRLLEDMMRRFLAQRIARDEFCVIGIDHDPSSSYPVGQRETNSPSMWGITQSLEEAQARLQGLQAARQYLVIFDGTGKVVHSNLDAIVQEGARKAAF